MATVAFLTAAGEQAYSDYGLPSTGEDVVRNFDFVLVSVGGVLELRDNGDPRGRPISVDLKPVRARSYPTKKNGALATAIGRRNRFVVDATAGLGKDMLLLFAMGYRVLAVERSPAIAALLEDGLRRLASEPCMGQAALTAPALHFGDARQMLAALAAPPDCVYLDPMFPSRKKRSALARRELRILRRIVGADEDAAQLFDTARRIARNRVVVKRADDAPPLAANPDQVYRTPTVRYDVYLTC